MLDYQPLDLVPQLNAGLDALGPNTTADIGAREFRGLPFLIGEEPDRCFIALNGDSDPIRIPVCNSAFNIVFAHRLLHSDIEEGGPVGIHVADYVFVLGDGRRLVVPIRERFEIGVLPTDLFQTPFRAVSNGKQQSMPRHQGAWNDMGRRQTEYVRAAARSYFLWSWSNPEPETTVRSVEIVPKGPAFIIAAATLGLADEYPIARLGRREAIITFDDSDLAQRLFDVEVEVDRGDSPYAFRLPIDAETGFMEAYHQGYGEIRYDTANPSTWRSPPSRRRPSRSSRMARPSDRCDGATWRSMVMRRHRECVFHSPTTGVTGLRWQWWMTRPVGQYRAGSTSGRRKASLTSPCAQRSESNRASSGWSCGSSDGST